MKTCWVKAADLTATNLSPPGRRGPKRGTPQRKDVLTAHERAVIYALRLEGASYRACAKAVGVSLPTAYYALNPKDSVG